MMMMMITQVAPSATAPLLLPGRGTVPTRWGTTRIGWKWDPHNNNNNNNNNKRAATTTTRSSPLRAIISDSSPGSSFPLASRIIVTNLGYFTSESSLREEFSLFGQVAEVELIKKYEDGGGFRRAFAFVQYTNQNDAILALETMHGAELDGKLICVDIAKPGREHFGRYPKATGPPKKLPIQKRLKPEDDFADCWY